MNNYLIDRLSALPGFSEIPREELGWLVKHGNIEIQDPGIIAPKGDRIEHLWIILSGHMTIRVDRGTGPKMVTEWRAGQVIGILPYSRMVQTPGDTYAEEKSETLKIHRTLFPQMINKCPLFTAFTVHSMIDRVRTFNTSDLHDEKMVSLGKLAAGLAHELNNPASVTLRDAKLLKTGLHNLDTASRLLGAAGLTDEQFRQIDKLRTICLERNAETKLSAILKADLQDDINHWLEDHQQDSGLAASLTDTTISFDELNQLTAVIPENKLGIVLNWIIAGCSTRALATDMERSTSQIHRLVDAVKKFSYMDNLAENELINVEQGIKDTLNMLVNRIKLKNASVEVEFDPNLPLIYANGGELNQVWLNLIDNALYAIPHSGKIKIAAHAKLNRLEVRIADNGPGIEQHIIPKIFDPFFTTKPPGQGAGLGLDITRRLLLRCRGDITVISRPGKTEFCVILPVDKP